MDSMRSPCAEINRSYPRWFYPHQSVINSDRPVGDTICPAVSRPTALVPMGGNSIRFVLDDVPRLTIQKLADFVECGKAHTLGAARANQRNVLFGDSDVMCKLLGFLLPQGDRRLASECL